MYGFALGGWALFLYFMQILWDNLQVVLLSYKTYVAWYIVVSGVISFFICYRMDPLQNEKNRKIVKWSLQVNYCPRFSCSIFSFVISFNLF